MNLGHADAIRLAQELRAGLGSVPDRDVAIFPAFLSVAAIAEAMSGTPIRVGAQNCAATEDGAFTGEVSASMISSVGAKSVILGHSERRQLFFETDELVRQKTALALARGLLPIVCVGETRAEREAGATLSVVDRQLRGALAGLSKDQISRICLAYEPVWAIGTGLVATPEQAQEVHAALRRTLRELAPACAEDLRILYGGSVKGSNIDGLMTMPDLDGALVGGASLKADEFLRIIHFRRA